MVLSGHTCEGVGPQAGRGELGRHPPIRAENPMRRIVYGLVARPPGSSCSARATYASGGHIQSLQSAIDRGA